MISRLVSLGISMLLLPVPKISFADTIQLANFEFFSGVFKDISVSVAQTFPVEKWKHIGTYRAKNVRSVQVCPVSLHNDTHTLSILSHSSHREILTFTVMSALTSYLTTALSTTAQSAFFASMD